MRSANRVPAGGALLAWLALAAVLPATAGAAPLRAHRVGGAAGAARFWTPRRLRAALSNQAAGPSPDLARLAGAPTARAQSVGRPFRVSGLPPAPQPRGAARISSMNVADAAAAVTRTNGRIFAIDPRQGPYSCSGTALNTPSGSIVLTAGHCVVENWSWGTHIIFIPAYDHGQRPFGTFVADAVYVTTQWRRFEDTDFDVAALHVAPNELGSLTSVVGGRGYEINRSRFSNFQIFGYPAGALQGQVLRECDTTGLGIDPLTTSLPGPPTLPSRCDMAAGSSGGAWIADGQYIDGVTSYSYAHNRGQLYSPYFGTAIGRFLGRLP